MPIDVFRVLPPALVVLGLLVVVLGLLQVVRDRRRRQSWVPCPGRVVASRLDDGQIRSRVAYVRDGREFAFWNRFTTTTGVDPVGREVEVLVNPQDPDDAVVSRGLVGGSVVGLVFVGFGALVVVVGLVLTRA